MIEHKSPCWKVRNMMVAASEGVFQLIVDNHSRITLVNSRGRARNTSQSFSINLNPWTRGLFSASKKYLSESKKAIKKNCKQGKLFKWHIKKKLTVLVICKGEKKRFPPKIKNCANFSWKNFFFFSNSKICDIDQFWTYFWYLFCLWASYHYALGLKI